MMDWKPDPQGWRRDFAETGYVVVENALDPEVLSALRDGLDALECAVANNSLPPDLRRHVQLERDRTSWLRAGHVQTDTISVILELALFDRVFAKLIPYPRVLDILEALFETPEFSFLNYKAIYKMPGGSAPFQWHRDLPYLPHTNANLLTCMLCIDPMTAENGATVVCPGSHRVPPGYLNQADVDMPEAQIPENRVPVICPAGSAVVFDVNIVHGGGPNVSDIKRRNVISIWAGPGCYPLSPIRAAYQFLMPRSTDPMRQRQVELSLK